MLQDCTSAWLTGMVVFMLKGVFVFLWEKMIVIDLDKEDNRRRSLSSGKGLLCNIYAGWLLTGQVSGLLTLGLFCLKVRAQPLSRYGALRPSHHLIRFCGVT